MPKERLIIVDGNALVHRAFHALPPTMQTKDGVLTNAVYGFLTIFFKVLKELKPQYAVLTFDLAKKTFRHEQFVDYKATRQKQPDELYQQLPIVKEIVRAFNIPIYEKEGFEADDLIGTITKKIDGSVEKYIVTGDLDTLQLVDPLTKVFTLRKGVKDTIIYDRQAVQEKYQGLTPEQMIDFKALRGDPSDNIPGVKGIGEKGAVALLKKYHNLKNIYQNIKQIKGATQQKLIASKEQAFLSQHLATIVRDVPVNIKLADCRLDDFSLDQVYQVLSKYEFKSLLNQLSSIPQFKSGQPSLLSSLSQPKIKTDYQLVDTLAKAKQLRQQLAKQKIFSLDTETNSLDFISNKLVGFSVSWQAHSAYFVLADLLPEFKSILADPNYRKVGHNLKFDWHALHNSGVELQGIAFDTMLASYLLNPGTRQHALDKLAFSELGRRMLTYEELCGHGQKQIPLTEVPLDRLTAYASADADIAWQLYRKLEPLLKKEKLDSLFIDLEMPLLSVLATMENNGVVVDAKFLAKMDQKLKSKIKNLESKIYQIAGAKFNIASPLQLKEVLFDKLKIKSEKIKRIKTGLSTAASELSKMRSEHKIIPLLEEYRELTKLLNTYIEALPRLINPQTKRLHTSFNQTITATGRLSSSEPNLQNIPMRTDLGREIRLAFIAPAGYQIASLDYSQIELRIVAHLSQDPKMLEAFHQDEDIHRRTAAELNDVPLDQVTPTMRREAKSVNFGIIYGMGVYGLAQDAGISREQAAAFLDRYFSLHPGVSDYITKTKRFALQHGYVETLLGRRRYLPDINSGIFQLRQAAERMAVNMPAQGTAADLMKKAMLQVQQAIDAGKIKAKMILQVHDELVFEIKSSEVSSETKKIQASMEQAHHFAVRRQVFNNLGALV